MKYLLSNLNISYKNYELIKLNIQKLQIYFDKVLLFYGNIELEGLEIYHTKISQNIIINKSSLYLKDNIFFYTFFKKAICKGFSNRINGTYSSLNQNLNEIELNFSLCQQEAEKKISDLNMNGQGIRFISNIEINAKNSVMNAWEQLRNANKNLNQKYSTYDSKFIKNLINQNIFSINPKMKKNMKRKLKDSNSNIKYSIYMEKSKRLLLYFGLINFLLGVKLKNSKLMRMRKLKNNPESFVDFLSIGKTPAMKMLSMKIYLFLDKYIEDDEQILDEIIKENKQKDDLLENINSSKESYFNSIDQNEKD